MGGGGYTNGSELINIIDLHFIALRALRVFCVKCITPRMRLVNEHCHTHPMGVKTYFFHDDTICP